MDKGKILQEIENDAKQMHIPIIDKEASEVLVKVIKETNPRNILEIGTAIGYSGCLMLLNSVANLITIEKSAVDVQKAKENFEKLDLAKRVNIIHGDANEVVKTLCQQNKFDFIFLDGPKSKYVSQLPYLLTMLEVGGTIFADDVLFMGLVNSDVYPEHKHRTIVLNLRKFIKDVQINPCLSSQLLEVGEGVMIIKKKF